MNTSSSIRQLAAGLALAAFAVVSSGCSPVNKLIAKDTLNNGVREFNKGHYPEAEGLFKKALEHDPNNRNAKLFYAMTLNARLKREPSEQLGAETIKAYQDVVAENPTFEQKDRAYAFIAEVHRTVMDTFDPEKDAAKIEQYKAERRKWLVERANLPNQTKEIQAQMLYSIGQAHWQEVNQLIRSYEKKPATQTPGPPQPPVYDVPPDKRAEAADLIAKGHDYMRQALEKDSDYADAYAYEKLLFLEEAKLTTDAAARKELIAKAQAAQDTYSEKNSERQRREAEAAAAQEPEAAKGE